MELIFGFLPLPLAIVTIVVVGVGGVLVRKYVKNKTVVDIANQVTDAVVTRERVDQTVEAVLAKLKLDPTLADKIGDFIADLVLRLTQNASESALRRRSVADRRVLAKNALQNAGQIEEAVVVTELLSRPNLVMDTITSVAPADVLADPLAKIQVTRRVVQAVVEGPQPGAS